MPTHPTRGSIDDLLDDLFIGYTRILLDISANRPPFTAVDLVLQALDTLAGVVKFGLEVVPLLAQLMSGFIRRYRYLEFL